MGLFTKRWQREHHLARDPEIDIHAVDGHPVVGDILVWSDDYGGKMIPASPPIDPTLVDAVADQDLVWWDATDAQLEAVSALDVVSSQAAYASMTVLDGAVAQAVTAVAAPLDSFDTNGPSSFVTPDHTADTLTVDVGGAGDYEVSFTASFSYAAAAVLQFRLRVDAVETSLGGQVEVLNVGDIVHVSFNGFVTLADAEVVTVYVEADADSNITVIDAQLKLMRVHN